MKATHTGERLDRFELVAEIASGGMATVFLARLEGVAGFQRLYAIKRLHPHLAKEGEFVDMFLDEARLAARIHHPNVVPILEVGTSEQGYYLVMEYIEGDTAARLLARCAQTGGRLPPAVAVRIALDTLQGLHAAHDLTDDEGRPLHIVHRDVSPQNVLVGIDGIARITDFGVAHAATRLSSTRTGQLKGKLAYMAPEHARGALVDRRSDVFAMGVVLWELCAGKRLFKAGNDAETLHRILFAPLPTLRDAGVDVPIPIDAVCTRALAREAADRHQSAAEFADELERVARSLDMLASTREVATYVDGAIGAEISQQREVVRAWMARSEPSRNDRIVLPLSPDARRSSRTPGAPEDSAARALRHASSRDVTLGGPASKRGGVSSVSSAVLEMPEATRSESSLEQLAKGASEVDFAPRHQTRVLWSVAALAAVTTVAAMGVVLRTGHKPSAVSAASSTMAPAVTSSVGQPGPALTAGPTATPPPTASALPTDAAAPAGSLARPGRPTPPPTKPGMPARTGRPAGAPAAPSDDDDLSRNPYR